MATAVDPPRAAPHALPIHPAHAMLLAGSLPLFVGALLSDWAYGASYEVQWANFAAWLLTGGLVLSGLALLWSLIDLLRTGRRDRRAVAAFLLLLATWGIGLIDALVHSKDAWAMMPEGLILSVLVTLLAVAAVWAGLSGGRGSARA